MSERRVPWLSCCCLVALGCGVGAAAAETLTPAREDPHHPLSARLEFYPHAARMNRQQGLCRVALYTGADGMVRAVQLLDSTGYPQLDAACIQSVALDRVIPATADGRPVPGWLDASIVWQYSSESLIPTAVRNKWSVPRLPPYFQLRVGPEFYPQEARDRRQEGACFVLVHVDRQGAVRRADIAKSSGYPLLDAACRDAVVAAPFAPAQGDEEFQDAVAAITMFWRLG